MLAARRLATDALANLAAAQDDVVSRRQLARLGLHRDRVRAQLDARRWQALGPRVVVLHNGPLTTRQRWWAAVLNAGADSALAGLSAADYLGLRGFETGEVHVVVRAGARVPALDGVRVHQSTRLTPSDLHPARSLPSVRMPRALVDAAVWSPSARTACAILASGVQQRLVPAAALTETLAPVRTARHRGLLLAVLGDIAGGAQALSEIDFVRLCRRYGLPEPRRQAIRRDAQGRRRYLDADFDVFSAEVDGGIHLRPIDAWADDERHNGLVVAGERQLRFPSVVVRLAETAVVRWLTMAFDRFGWPDGWKR